MLQQIETLLVCPTCKSDLIQGETNYQCSQAACAASYPIIKKIPVLLDERVSTFNVTPYSDKRNALPSGVKSLKQRIRACTPRIGRNFVAESNLSYFKELLLKETRQPRVLVLGGATVGEGMKGLLADQRLQFLETDIAIGPRTELICDTNYLPLKDESVDGVVTQAVLEYVLDPVLCVREIHRVLRPHGIVYSEMPFMQHVHGGRYDFTRFTHLGHRRLYRCFSEIASGASAGPATVLAWSIQNFFLAFVRSPLRRDAVKLAMGWSLFWLKYFDYFLVNTPGGLDGASGTYLLARKSETVFSDRDLIASYRGAVPRSEFI